jgi:hypothetical protein
MKSVYDDPAYASVVKELTAEIKRLQEQYKVPDDRGSVPKDPPVLQPGFKPMPRPAAKKKA